MQRAQEADFASLTFPNMVEVYALIARAVANGHPFRLFDTTTGAVGKVMTLLESGTQDPCFEY